MTMPTTTTDAALGWPELRDTRILVADRDAHAVEALSQVLEDSGARTAKATGGPAALRLMQSTERFDAAVVDYFLTPPRGPSLLRPLREHLTCSLVISAVDKTEVTQQAISSGADDFLAKPFKVPAFLEAVTMTVTKTRHWRRRVAESRHQLRSEAQPRSRNSLDEQFDRVVQLLSRKSGLSQKETGVVRLVVDSLTSEQIAGRLGISVSTVKYHDKRARAKLGADNRDLLRQMVYEMLRRP